MGQLQIEKSAVVADVLGRLVAGASANTHYRPEWSRKRSYRPQRLQHSGGGARVHCIDLWQEPRQPDAHSQYLSFAERTGRSSSYVRKHTRGITVFVA